MDNIQKAGPRYTSYPSANHFAADFGRVDFLKALWSLGKNPRPLSLYIHVPFCYQLCYFCGCNKIVGHKPSKLEAYIQTLVDEIALVSHEVGEPNTTSDQDVKQIHFGGGTPNSFSPAQLAVVVSALRAAFNVSDKVEMSIEVDPRHLTTDDLIEYKHMGFNRLSIGIQDFNPLVQEAINRVQSQESIQTLMQKAAELGFEGVNMDLIYGLPHQTQERFEATLDAVCGMRPSRIALYSYAHMPEKFKAQTLIKREHLPDADEKLSLLNLAIIKLKAAGYEYIGLDHFALPEDALAIAQKNGSLQRNFQGYSTHQGCDLLGFGVSAISNLNGQYAQNSKLLSDYAEHIHGGQLATSVGYRLNDEETIRRDLIMQLMCSRKLNVEHFGQTHGICFHTVFADEMKRLQPFIERDLIRYNNNELLVTNLGRFVLRAIAMVFDQHVDAQAPLLSSQHSEVV